MAICRHKNNPILLGVFSSAPHLGGCSNVNKQGRINRHHQNRENIYFYEAFHGFD